MSGSDTPGVPALFHRAEVVEVDLAAPLPDLGAPADRGPEPVVLVVVWLCTRPVGMLFAPADAAGDALAELIGQELGPLVEHAARDHGLPDQPLTASGLGHPDCPQRRTYTRLAADGPPVSVVLCTRNRAESLRRCLESLVGVRYANRQILVIDNNPSDSTTRKVCAALADRLPLEYHREDLPGLSHARNRGVSEARHDLVAFLDDDERVHPDWLSALAGEFVADPRLGAASGLVLPAELRTDAQVRFEQYGGHSKGRGFRREVFDRAYQRRQPAMFPFPAFGVGANMAFRREALADAGEFDVALGAGTATGGAEDTAAFTEVLLAGWAMVYAPAAVTWHYHRDDATELTRQRDGYSRGLGAYYTALLRRDPRRVAGLAIAAVTVGPTLLARGRAAGAREHDADPESGSLRFGPVLRGPGAYISARRKARAAAAQVQRPADH